MLSQVLKATLLVWVGLFSLAAAATNHDINWRRTLGDQGTLVVNPGDAVTWTWGDAQLHSVTPTSSPPGFNASDLAQETNYTFTVFFLELGEFGYTCSNHAIMEGVIKVVPANDPIVIDWRRTLGDQGTLVINPGDAVTWIWGDNQLHDVTPTSSPPGFEASDLVQQNGYNYTVLFMTLGNFSYDCSNHAVMEGVISVVPAGPPYQIDWRRILGDQGTLYINPGDAVTWTWGDAQLHSVTPTTVPPGFVGPGFNGSHLVQESGYSYTVVFMSLGEFGYVCSNHGVMEGIISVINGAVPTHAPTLAPTEGPTNPTMVPSEVPTFAPTTASPTVEPTISHAPTSSSAPTLGWFEPDKWTIDWSLANGDQGGVVASPGDIVTWVWGDNLAHNVVPTSDPPGFSASDVIQEEGYSYSQAMTQLGDFGFEDTTSNGTMKGVISVIARGAEHIVDWSLANGDQGTLEIEPGDVVTWMWGDNRTHDVSPTSNPLWGFSPSELVQEEGNNFTYVFNKLGRFGFECTNHPGQMFGTVAVLALNPPILINWGVASGDQGTLYVNRLDTVTWVWTDDEVHNIEPETQRLPFDWVATENVAQRGYNHSIVFGEFGEYPYTDSNNPNTMKGIITVNNAVLPSRAPTPAPSVIPTAPTFAPSEYPTAPTDAPTKSPAPTFAPTASPTEGPTAPLTEAPSAAPFMPTEPPTGNSLRPTRAPTTSDVLVSGASTTLGCHTPAAVALPIAIFGASMLFL